MAWLYQGEAALPTKLREVRSEPHITQSASQTETDFAMMSVWLMICLINAVIPRRESLFPTRCAFVIKSKAALRMEGASLK